MPEECELIQKAKAWVHQEIQFRLAIEQSGLGDSYLLTLAQKCDQAEKEFIEYANYITGQVNEYNAILERCEIELKEAKDAFAKRYLGSWGINGVGINKDGISCMLENDENKHKLPETFQGFDVSYRVVGVIRPL